MGKDAERFLLIVEDSEDIQLLLATLFESEGYAVQCAANGQEALQFLRTTKRLPGTILLDLTMPVMDGYRFREEQEKDARLAGIPIVVMTAAGEVQAKAEKVGARASLKKPFSDLDAILQTVGQAFGNT